MKNSPLYVSSELILIIYVPDFAGTFHLCRWYNVPPSPSKTKKKAQSKARVNATTAETENSTPLNFDTFVPTHDPSLASAQDPSATPPHPPSVPGPDYAQYYLANPPGPMVSQDEAFQRALSAMYWGGYWTAVYHVSKNCRVSSRLSNHESVSF